MHAYYKTTDNRTIAIRDTGMDKAVVSKAILGLTRIPAPANAKALRESGAIATCRVLENGRIGAI